MGLSKSKEKDYAKLLYTQMGCSQKDIADKVGVSEKTISKWKTEENWEQLKTVLVTTRSNIIKNLQRQMELWQLEIGERLASSKETDILVKLAGSIRSLETETGISEMVDTGMKFINFLQQHNIELSKEVTHWFDLFIKTKM